MTISGAAVLLCFERHLVVLVFPLLPPFFFSSYVTSLSFFSSFSPFPSPAFLNYAFPLPSPSNFLSPFIVFMYPLLPFFLHLSAVTPSHPFSFSSSFFSSPISSLFTISQLYVSNSSTSYPLSCRHALSSFFLFLILLFIFQSSHPFFLFLILLFISHSFSLHQLPILRNSSASYQLPCRQTLTPPLPCC